MFNILNTNRAFVEEAIAEGFIRFAVRGHLAVEYNYGFSFGDVEIRVSPPNYSSKVVYVEPEEIGTVGFQSVYLEDVEGEIYFGGEVDLPERTERGIAYALNMLEIWADLLCLVSGNPKVQIEVQRPINFVSVPQYNYSLRLALRWEAVAISFRRLPTKERERIEAALWWYRKGCATRNSSPFNSYTAYWNCLEILCGVSGGRIRKGEENERGIQDYIRAKGNQPLSSHDISVLYNEYVNYSIRAQIQDALMNIRGFTGEIAERWTYYCFEISPSKERLYNIRNDINHGNIRENRRDHYRRVYVGGIILQALVVDVLYSKIRKRTNITRDVDTFVKRVLAAMEQADNFNR